MNLSVIKSPLLAEQKVQLGVSASHAATAAAVQARTAQDERAQVLAVERQRIETQIRQSLDKDYLARYEAERAKAYEQGYKEGLEAGHRDGVTTGIDGFRSQIGVLEKIVSKAEDALDTWLADCQNEAIDLAMESVTRILGENVLNAAVIAAMVQRVMTPLRESDVLGIRLHPRECTALRAALRRDALGELMPAGLIDRLHDDAHLPLGGCVIETPRGEYRATLDVQLSRLRQLLDEHRTQGTPPTAAIRHVHSA